MRFMSVSGMFSPFYGGGAEYSSVNLAKWLVKQGHEVGVLTTAPTPNDVLNGEMYEGLRYWRVYMPRLYSVHHKGMLWQKPIWHLQDHFDPANRRIASRVFDEFKPDFLNLHILQGLGHNIIKEIIKRDIPALYFQHDLGLVCIKRSMFSKGQNCLKQCRFCKISSRYQESMLNKMNRLTICSPSQANLDKIAKYFPLSKYKSKAVLNAIQYPEPSVEREEEKPLRLLYVGRLHYTKGIDLLIRVCSKVREDYDFSLTILGGGPQEETLKNEFADLPWLSFVGHVEQKEISNYMVNSDLLCFPSIWEEPLGGVAVHAFTLGLPVLGSRTGGIPEVIEHNKSGLLVTAGDEEAWEKAIRHVFEKPEDLKRWRKYSATHAARFSQDVLAKEIFKVIKKTMAQKN